MGSSGYSTEEAIIETCDAASLEICDSLATQTSNMMLHYLQNPESMTTAHKQAQQACMRAAILLSTSVGKQSAYNGTEMLPDSRQLFLALLI